MKLSDIANILMGQSPKGELCNTVGDGIGLLNGPTEFNVFYPIAKQFTLHGKKFSAKGDILFCVRGSTTGRMNWSDREYAIGRGLASIHHKNGQEYNHFLKYLIEYNLDALLHGSSGSTFPNLTSNIFTSFQVVVPKLLVQKKISSILSSLDKKIELNNKINQKLEAMAKTLYDYWFVQFDFPDAEGKPYKSSGGKMLYSSELKREIPEGWEVRELSKIESNIVTGKTPSTKKSEYYVGDIPFISIGDIRGNMHIVSTESTLTEEGANTQAKKYIPRGSICVTCIATIGLVGFATENSQTNQQINSIVCDVFENKYYLYFALKDYFKFVKAKTGNTFANMNKQDFSDIVLVYPANEVLKKFSNILEPSIDKILNNSLEKQKLTQLRDWLLPMLMNGQVTVGEYASETEELMVAEPVMSYGES